jgi:hypothetical protein
MTDNATRAVYPPMIARRAMREMERLAKVRQMLEAGLLTKKEAQERGL